MFSRVKFSLNGDSAEIYTHDFVKSKNYKLQLQKLQIKLQELKSQDFLYL